tara:strand:+ start:16436 stop:16693 length:258 start_codon:yes stop_codon:yes gene_type:complete
VIITKQKVFDPRLNRFRDITDKEELERDLDFYLRYRTGNTCEIKKTKKKLKEVKKELQETLKNLFEKRKFINNKVKTLRNKQKKG